MLTPASPPSASADEIVKLFVVEEPSYSLYGGARATEHTLNFTKMILSHKQLKAPHTLSIDGLSQEIGELTIEEFVCKVRRYGKGRWFMSGHVDSDDYMEIVGDSGTGLASPLRVALEEAWSSRVANIIMSE